MDPHSQMIVWLVAGPGAAAMTLGRCLVALHPWPDALTSPELGVATAILIGFSVAIVMLTTAWRSWFDRGPLEAGLRVPWEIVAEARRSA